MDKLLQNVEKELKIIADKGLSSSNVDMTYKLIDIYKDLKESDYYKEATHAMKEGGARMDDYGRGRYNEYDRGRYNGDEYDRRRYNGDEYDRSYYITTGPSSGRYRHLGPMEKYFTRLEDEVDNYNMSRDRYRNGGPQERVQEGMEMIMQAVHKFVECLVDYAETPKEKEIVRKYIDKMKNV